MTDWSCRVLEEHEVDRLLEKTSLCRMAMAAADQPYLLPMAVQTEKDENGDYVFRMQSPLYGTKMEYLQANRRVVLEFERPYDGGVESVVAFGIARFHLPENGGGRAEIKVTPYQLSGRCCTKQKHPEE